MNSFKVQLGSQVLDPVWGGVAEQVVLGQVWREVWDEVMVKVWDVVRGQVSVQVHDQSQESR